MNLNDILKIFLWKIAWDIDPSKSRLNKVFHISPSNRVCLLCNVEEDSFSHLFFSCFFARISWRLSLWPLDSLKWSSLSLLDWIKGILTPNNVFGIPLADLHLFQIFAAVLCDLLWFSRNQAIHKGERPDALVLTTNIKKVLMEHYAAWSSIKKPVKDIWTKPPQDFYKVNFDAAIREDFSTQAAVCKNSNGMIIKMLYQVTPLQSCVWRSPSTHLAGALATSMKLDKFIIDGDSSVVFSALQNPAHALDWHIENVIIDTLSRFLVSSL